MQVDGIGNYFIALIVIVKGILIGLTKMPVLILPKLKAWGEFDFSAELLRE